jgi:hypothetical protein
MTMQVTLRYAEVNVFFIYRMRGLEEEGHVKTEQLPYLIKLLYLISNIYFSKKELQFSLNFLKEVKNGTCSLNLRTSG